MALHGNWVGIDAPGRVMMAEALFMGVAFDTGGFRHSSTTAATYRMAADLVERGADPTKLMNALFHTKRFSEARGLSLLSARQSCTTDRF